jgi:hypothetical protein
MPLAVPNTTATASYVSWGGESNYASGFIWVANGLVEVELLHGPTVGISSEAGPVVLGPGPNPIAVSSPRDFIHGFKIRAVGGVVSSPAQQYWAGLWEPGLAYIFPTAPFDGTIGSGGGVVPTAQPLRILAPWAGAVPSATGNGLEWSVPFDADGSSFTFDLALALARLTATYTSPVQFRIESSPGGQVAFTPTTVVTLTVAPGDYESPLTATAAVSVASGDVLRLVFAALGPPVTTRFTTYVVGSE